MISRRGLFGIGVGAVATAVVPASQAAPILLAEDLFTHLEVGLDFGTSPHAAVFVMPGRTVAWQLANPEKMADYRRRVQLHVLK